MKMVEVLILARMQIVLAGIAGRNKLLQNGKDSTRKMVGSFFLFVSEELGMRNGGAAHNS